jgi:hypothetical protein
MDCPLPFQRVDPGSVRATARFEDSVPLHKGQTTPGLRMEAVEQGMVVPEFVS